jgi:hypothetical protein
MLPMESDASHIARQARSFGAVAQLYDQARPSYPAELFAHLAGHLPGPRVLEVGAGTGKATVGLTALGLEVTCIEPDPDMAAVLADHTAAGPRVRIEVETFEAFRPARALAVIQEPDTWPSNEIAAHPGFEYLGTSLFPWRQDYTAAEFGAFLESTSYYQVLDPEVRERLLTAVTTKIREQFDDLITLAWSAQCYDARRNRLGGGALPDGPQAAAAPLP